ncbi:MAG TPA: acetylornithine transaminase [Candidatus Bathyarchaeia archaeon]|nr:acetylornithine transaminase [Candidatus Bathyarchaeia archaeon]
MKVKKEDVVSKESQYYMPVFARQPLVVERGRGAIVTDTEGNDYIDCVAGIAVNVIGHCHPRLVSAIQAQAEKLIHTSNLYYTELQARLAERMAKLTGLERLYLTNSGAESNEAAMKLARKVTRKKDFISTKNAFHGRTMGALSLTWKETIRKPFEPLIDRVTFVEYGDVDAIARAVTADTAAVIVEPIQGEGGVNVPPEGYLRGVRDLCSELSILMIADEVQTGFGRTGKWFACEHEGVIPDIMTLAKGMGGGLPVGAMMSREPYKFTLGDHGGTQSGNPLACAAALATIDVIETESLIEQSQRKGELLKNLLGELEPTHTIDIRGKGLMVAYESSLSAAQIVDYARTNGVLLNNTSENVLRFVPPLVITAEQIEEAVAVVDRALNICSG